MIAAAALVGIMAATGCSGSVGTNADRLANNTNHVTGSTRRAADRLTNSVRRVENRLTNSAARPRNNDKVAYSRHEANNGRISAGRITSNSDRLSYNATNYSRNERDAGRGYYRSSARRIANNIARRGVLGRHSTTMTESNTTHNTRTNLNTNHARTRNAHHNRGLHYRDGSLANHARQNTNAITNNGLARVAPMPNNAVN